jgi:hypothetical protein
MDIVMTSFIKHYEIVWCRRSTVCLAVHVMTY